ncbi:hypothetical protein Syn7502_03601 (plasmid) [Synechococcus sp. PCC 7502]|nr:hypothetical protein Syn7502_03601 [Synechococcus sp. PCC 7502]
MVVYFVVLLKITDADRFMECFQAVMLLIEQRGGRLIAQGIPKVIEVSNTGSMSAMFEYPSRQAFIDYWHSKEYAEIRKLREGAVDFQGVIVAGVAA